jgi:Na+/H+ antiporter NhaA
MPASRLAQAPHPCFHHFTGIVAGLFLGKQTGIAASVFLAKIAGSAALPPGSLEADLWCGHPMRHWLHDESFYRLARVC